MKNEFTHIDANTIAIHTTSGYDILIDADDFDRVNAVNTSWTICRRKHTAYAKSCYQGDTVYMHRLIHGLQRGDKRVIDHRNGCGIDNRRENTAVVTQSENVFRKVTPPRDIPRNIYFYQNIYNVRISIEKTIYDGGCYKTLDAAIDALAKLKSQLNLQ